MTEQPKNAFEYLTPAVMLALRRLPEDAWAKWLQAKYPKLDGNELMGLVVWYNVFRKEDEAFLAAVNEVDNGR